MKTVEFKSDKQFFWAEESGDKSNTVREIDLEDERFKSLISGDAKKIKITSTDNINANFTRKISNVCIWKDLMIISW